LLEFLGRMTTVELDVSKLPVACGREAMNQLHGRLELLKRHLLAKIGQILSKED